MLFDGRDVRDATLSSLRGRIGLVFQETFVFDTTLRENVALAREGATDAEVVEAIRAARLEEWVDSLPAGSTPMLGERGVRMSGGQRQRLAVARALVRDPSILILDEATSALDARTEAEILATLAEAARGRTTVSITHRLSLAARADRRARARPRPDRRGGHARRAPPCGRPVPAAPRRADGARGAWSRGGAPGVDPALRRSRPRRARCAGGAARHGALRRGHGDRPAGRRRPQALRRRRRRRRGGRGAGRARAPRRPAGGGRLLRRAGAAVRGGALRDGAGRRSRASSTASPARTSCRSSSATRPSGVPSRRRSPRAGARTRRPRGPRRPEV